MEEFHLQGCLGSSYQASHVYHLGRSQGQTGIMSVEEGSKTNEQATEGYGVIKQE